MKCRELAALSGNHFRDWNPSVNVQHGYFQFFQALHNTAERMVLPFEPEMIMDIFHATMILFMIRRILYGPRSSRELLGPPPTKGDSFTTGYTNNVFGKIVTVLETSDQSLSSSLAKLDDDTYLTRIPTRPLRGITPYLFTKEFLKMLYSGATLVGLLKWFIDAIELR